MFLSDTHLPQLLPPSAYTDPTWYITEREHVLAPAWHAVATTSQFPRDGSFVTFDLFGYPIVLRRHGSVIRGFLNVCAHRLAKLTSQPTGYCSALRCGYHGWEYDEVSGATKKIPDAPSFKPLEKGMLGLTSVRVETCGGLVFATLSEDAPCMAQSLLACGIDVACKISSMGCLGMREIYFPVNWKVAIENTMESYHVEEVHPRTFKRAPAEEQCSHELFPSVSVFRGPGDTVPWIQRLEGVLLSGAAVPHTGGYRHTHLYPTCTLAETDTFTIVLSFLPESADRTRLFMSWFGSQRAGASAVWNSLIRSWGRVQSGFWLKVVNEVLSMLPTVQQGLASPSHPGTGLISRREERITHFQRWILDRMHTDTTATQPATTLATHSCPSAASPMENVLT